MKPIFKKLIACLSIFTLLFGQLSTPTIVLAEELTQESTSSANEETLTDQDPKTSSSSDSTPALLNETLTVPATESANLSLNLEESEGSATLGPSTWKSDPDGSFTTSNPVVLNQAYRAPTNEKVSVTFTKLPENPGTLTIKQIILSQEDKEDLGAISDTAYDITSTMENGSFEYVLTLPAPYTEGVEVKASEDRKNFVTLGGVTAQEDRVTITGLTHFTIFVVTDPFPDSSQDVLINEVVINPSPGGKEWVEVYNNSSEEVDLTDWYIEDSDGRTINLSGTIVTGGVAVFENNGSPMFPNTGIDDIYLYDNNDNQIDKVQYDNDGSGNDLEIDADLNGSQNLGTISQGQSFGRTTDGAQTWAIFATPTPGGSNGSTTTDTVYVDDNQDCSGNFPCFSTIQAAIEAVVEGGTVSVASGEYQENLVISKELSLLGDVGDEQSIGPGENAPIVLSDCNGPVISIEASDVIISGFVIDEDECGDYGIEIASGFSGSRILYNEIYNSQDYGIYNSGSTNTLISRNAVYNNNGGIGMGGGESSSDVSGTQILGNNIHENYGNGIYVGGVTFSSLTISNNVSIDSNEGSGIWFGTVAGATLTISGNTITNNDYEGIYIDQIEENSEGQESTVDITGNTITDNVQDDGYAGIYINNVYNSSIVNIGGSEEVDGNTVSDNFGRGIYICAEGECQDSTITVRGNTIENNDSAGVSLYWLSSSTLTVEGNEISLNGGSGFELEYIGSSENSSESPSTTSLLSNTIDENEGYGIYLGQTDSESSITIGTEEKGNTISNNTDAGIYLNSNVTGVSIVGNTIQNNGSSEEGEGGGLEIFTGIVVNSAPWNEAHQNIISNNGVGVQNNDEDNSFDARENWWGFDSGPLHDELNPEGEEIMLAIMFYLDPFT